MWFPSNDPLVDIHHSAIHPIAERTLKDPFPFDGPIKKIYQKALNTQRENGAFPFCLAEGSIQWMDKGNEVISPLWLTPITTKIDRVRHTIHLNEESSYAFVNPYVVQHLQRDFGLIVPEENGQLSTFIDWLRQEGFQGVDPSFYAIGNFHHHRFALVKELEAIRSLPESTLVNEILGDYSVQSQPKPLHIDYLYPLDRDQLGALEKFETSHLVVQGPPGTGKSQVLATILANCLASGENALVVSEKRVALEVLQKKLGQFGLDQYSFIASSATVSRDFIEDLKLCWQRMEDPQKSVPNTSLRLSEQLLDQLQLQLDILNTPGIAGGIDYHVFRDLEPAGIQDVEFFSQLPDMGDWLKQEQLVREIYDRSIARSVGQLKRQLIGSPAFNRFDVLLRQWQEELQQLNAHFSIETWGDLHKAMKTAANCQLFQQPLFQEFASLIQPDSSNNKRYHRLRTAYLKARLAEEHTKSKCIDWKIVPSPLECQHLLEIVEKRGLWNQVIAKKKWSKYASIPLVYASNALNDYLDWSKSKDEKEKIQRKLIELGVLNPDTDIPVIDQFQRAYTASDWQEWVELSNESRHNFADKNNLLNGLYTSIKNNLNISEQESIRQLFDQLILHFPVLLGMRDELLQLTENLSHSFKQFSTFDGLFAAVYKRTLVELNNHFPQLGGFSIDQMTEKCLEITALKEEEAFVFSRHIHAEQYRRFQAYSFLLTQASQKLSAEQKELKRRLRNGKSILVKVFSKSRNLPSIRELFSTDALLWIRVIKPLWLSSPSQVAANIPLETGLFSVTLMDEASQLPLSHAIGSLYRSKHVIVAGDSQQMGPSSFFRQSDESVDVLHQASFQWPTVMLTHHYRSEHPELISFSNHFFYENKLIAYPSAIATQHPIQLIYCPLGRFDERENEIEAIEVAKCIENALSTGESVGVVAFSATQLTAIERKLKPQTLQLLEDKLERNEGFFKSLEHVQGEECDHLIISMGYGKNQAGDFQLRFGPLNQSNGSKRLNVLFTRAKKSIAFVTSVRSDDFKISETASVNLLRHYIRMAEEHAVNESELLLPFQLKPKQQGTTLHFSHLYTAVPDAQELVTLITVLTQRGWKIQ